MELYAPVQGGKFEAAVAEQNVQEIPNIAHLLHEVNTANRQIMIEVDKLKGTDIYMYITCTLKGTNIHVHVHVHVHVLILCGQACLFRTSWDPM